jgi:nondiscriminating glutamyl-tRNA synthetase
MKEQSVERVVELARPHLVKAGLIEESLSPEQEEWVTNLIAMYQEKMSYGAEIVELAGLFFKEDLSYKDEAKGVLAEEQVPEVLRAFADKAAALDPFEADGVKKAMKDVQKETGHKGKKLFMPIRAAVTGQTHGPDLPKAIELLGRKKVLQRLNNILD